MQKEEDEKKKNKQTNKQTNKQNKFSSISWLTNHTQPPTLRDKGEDKTLIISAIYEEVLCHVKGVDGQLGGEDVVEVFGLRG